MHKDFVSRFSALSGVPVDVAVRDVGAGVGAPTRPRARLAGAVVVAVLGVALALPAGALAHGGPRSTSKRFLSVVTGIVPPVPGLDVSLDLDRFRKQDYVLPKEANPLLPADWLVVSTGQTWEWHDHRIQYMGIDRPDEVLKPTVSRPSSTAGSTTSRVAGDWGPG